MNASIHNENTYVPPKAACDLIMKGGITSGVIYPKLIGKLAEKYRLKNIGGTSAGAIAAAGAAAAEFHRHTQNTNAGFDELKKLPDFLGENINERSRLLSLFQPTPRLKPHFNVLLNTLNVERPGVAALETMFQMLCHFPSPLLLGLTIGTFLLWSTFLGLTAGNLLAAFCGSLAILGGWIVDTLVMRYWFQGKKIKSNNYLCRAIAIWFLNGIAWTFVVAELLCNITVPFFVFGLEVGSLALEVLLTSFVVLVATLIFFTYSMMRGLTENGFGFCNGLNAEDGTEPEALTKWLTGYFNKLAGLGENDSPLTFGDLWRGSRNQAANIFEVKKRVINLEMMTSAVSRKMPYAIPFIRDEKEYLFDPVEWSRLFPHEVIEQMKGKGTNEFVYEKEPSRSLYFLPGAESWPIVVAVRMSLSFPLLLSAVPLYAVDSTLKSVNNVRKYNGEVEKHNKYHKDKREKKPIPVSKVWFSDGGISSNMPLHFFDAILPEHPTFAINLTEKESGGAGNQSETSSKPGFEDWRIFLAVKNDQGLQKHWKSPSEIGITGLFGFLWSVMETMQNWRDEIQLPYPGYRDRIVQICQAENEGGLNLDMRQEAIEALGNAGENAAEHLINRFVDGDGWPNHRKIRLRSLLAQLELKLDDLDDTEIVAWQTLLNDSALDKPYKMNEEEKKLAIETLTALMEMAKRFRNALPAVTLAGSHAPRPFAEIRITPRF